MYRHARRAGGAVGRARRVGRRLFDAAYVPVINKKKPAKDLQEFVALAKERAGTLNCGTTGVGGSNHLVDKPATGKDVAAMAKVSVE